VKPGLAEAPAPAQNPRYDVIIVGAGMAGLTSAKVLRGAGLNIVVIEATNRIGGRGITTEALGKGFFSAPIDLGGAWIHGVRTNPLTPIIVGSGFKTTRTDVDTPKHLFFKGRFATKDEQEKFEAAYEAFEDGLERALADGGEDAKEDGRYVAASKYLETPEFKALDPVLQRLMALNSGPLESATELEKSSIEDSVEFISEDDDFVDEGYGTFVEEYGKDVKPFVRLGLPVTKITRRDGGVVVEAGKGEIFEGRKAVVTVSTGVLTKKKIAFEPDLPESKWKAIEALPMGLMNKVILELTTDKVFPIQGGKGVGGGLLKNTWVLYGGSNKDGTDDLAFVFRPLDKNIAVGFFGGQRAWELEKLANRGSDKMIDIAVRAMTEMCKKSRPNEACDVKGAVKKAKTTAWGLDEWTYGAYSAAKPGMAKMREELARPVDNVIYFAGEACYNSTYNGSFAAAYNSALRAAFAIAVCFEQEKRGGPGGGEDACAWRPMTGIRP
jgi:monoamine oxidase